MPRISKQATRRPDPETAGLAELAREASKEAALWMDRSQATRLTYEAKSAQLSKKGGWDMATACKQSRNSMRAAHIWVMRRDLKRLLKVAKKAIEKGDKGHELQPIRALQYGIHMEAVREKLGEIRTWEAKPWFEIDDPGRRLQKSHKQAPAKDSELILFYEAAQRSSFRTAFLAAEFGGCRGAEFGSGVRIELCKKGGVPTMQFFIQSAKADGNKKGLDLRCVESTFPAGATPEVQRRWLELAGMVKAKNTFVVKIAPGKEKQPKEGGKAKPPETPGQRFTNACKTVSKASSMAVAAYSLRHRFSAQVKAANKGDAVAVALALGHQTTETQRHYSRASRGGGDISPMQVVGVAVPGSQAVRGARQRTGPPQEIKDKIALGKSTPPAAATPPPKPRGPRL